MTRRIVLLLSLLMLAAGCEHQQALRSVTNWNSYQNRLGQVRDWQFEGKLVVQVPGDASRANINWQQNSHDYAIRLWGAFGQGTTWIRGDGTGVSLEQAGEQPLYAHSAEQLLYETLGYEFPVENLRYWVRGLPSPRSKVQAMRLTQEGVLESLDQSGWILKYDRYERVREWNLPGRIVASRDGLKLTLRVNDWRLSGG